LELLKILKSNPVLNGVFIFIIILGILLVLMVFIIGFSSHSDTETLKDRRSSFGYGHELEAGDVLEVTYEIEGEDVDVYITKDMYLPFNDDHEDVVVVRHNTKSGTLRYTAKEDEIHMVHFKGYDFTVTYTYRVDKPWFTFSMIVMGGLMVIIGLVGIWWLQQIPNPKYRGDYLRNGAIIFILVGFILIILHIVLITEYTVHILNPVLAIVFGLEYLYLSKAFDRHYYLITKYDPEETENKIGNYLEDKKIRYSVARSLKVGLIKWHAIILLDQTDVRIKIRRLRFQEMKSEVVIGRQNALNKGTLIELANDLGQTLECHNLQPIQT
jgi:hypothetical protein